MPANQSKYQIKAEMHIYPKGKQKKLERAYFIFIFYYFLHNERSGSGHRRVPISLTTTVTRPCNGTMRYYYGIGYSMLACKQKQEQDTLHEHRTFIRFFKHQSI
jgi:hypothetical protein